MCLIDNARYAVGSCRRYTGILNYSLDVLCRIGHFGEHVAIGARIVATNLTLLLDRFNQINAMNGRNKRQFTVCLLVLPIRTNFGLYFFTNYFVYKIEYIRVE